MCEFKIEVCNAVEKTQKVMESCGRDGAYTVYFDLDCNFAVVHCLDEDGTPEVEFYASQLAKHLKPTFRIVNNSPTDGRLLITADNEPGEPFDKYHHLDRFCDEFKEFQKNPDKFKNNQNYTALTLARHIQKRGLNSVLSLLNTREDILKQLTSILCNLD